MVCHKTFSAVMVEIAKCLLMPCNVLKHKECPCYSACLKVKVILIMCKQLDANKHIFPVIVSFSKMDTPLYLRKKKFLGVVNHNVCFGVSQMHVNIQL